MALDNPLGPVKVWGRSGPVADHPTSPPPVGEPASVFGFAFPCTFLGAPEAPLSQLGSQSLSAPLPSSMSFPFCTFSALGGNSGVPVPPTQWTGRGRGTLEVGFPSSTSGSSSSDHPLLLALGVVVLDGQTGLLEWGSLCVRGMWVRSRREIVTPAPGTHPRTFSICPTPPPFHCTLNSN